VSKYILYSTSYTLEAGGADPPSEKRYGQKPGCLAQLGVRRDESRQAPKSKPAQNPHSLKVLKHFEMPFLRTAIRSPQKVMKVLKKCLAAL